MGNQAVVCFGIQDTVETTPVVHFHWNGGPESIWALIDTAREYDQMTMSNVVKLATMLWPETKVVSIDAGFASENAMARSAPDHGAFFFTYGIAYPRRLMNTSCGVLNLSLQEVLEEAKAARGHPTYKSIRAFLAEALSSQERLRYAWECGAIAAA
jgi:hypothetical protein